MTHEKMMEDVKTQKAIKEVDSAIEIVRTTAKKVTKAAQKLQRQTELNRQPAEVKWESEFAGEVWIGKEYREFWVQDPYENPIVNLVTSNGTVILSAWESTKENPFMRAVVREFHELIASRGDTSLIENRLITIAMQLSGSKKRADWYAQSAEGLVLTDGERMELKTQGSRFYLPESFESFNFSQGDAYKKAQHCSRQYSHRYEYVEGFALLGHKLFHHAWIKDKTDGKAVDVTFNEPEIQLFGIVFDIEWVDKAIASRLKDDSISLRFSQSVIEGNFLDDFALLKSGVTPPGRTSNGL